MNNTTLSEVSKAQFSVNTLLSSNLGNASGIYNDINNQVDDDINRLVSLAFENFRSAGFDGVAGLEINKIKAMQNAIDEYVNGINQALSPLNQVDGKALFGNQMNKAIDAFVLAVKGYCEPIITNMQAFKQDLEKIKIAMEAKSQNVNVAVDSRTNDLNSFKSGWTYSAGDSD